MYVLASYRLGLIGEREIACYHTFARGSGSDTLYIEHPQLEKRNYSKLQVCLYHFESIANEPTCVIIPKSSTSVATCVIL